MVLNFRLTPTKFAKLISNHGGYRYTARANYIKLLKWKISLNSFLLSKNKQDISHGWHGNLHKLI